LIAAQNVLIDIYSQTIFRLKNDPAFIEEINKHNQNHELKLKLNFPSAQDFHDDTQWSYFIKRMIITNNLYGVDIEEGAGEIGKLRLWLSMIADVPKDISLVEPLPNIEYNLRCGNSLIGFTNAAQVVDEKDLSKKPKKKIVWNTLSGAQISLDTYQPDSIFHLYNDRNQLIRQYKEADDSTKAADLKDTIDQKTFEYNQVLNKKLFDEIIYEKGVEITEEAFTNLKPFHWIMEFSEIFERGGFDIILGNPPYVRQELIRDQKGLLKVFYPDVFQGTADLYIFFINRSINLLHPKGIFSYIVANKWMRANYGKPLRKWLKTLNIEQIIDFKDLSLFGGATTYTCIIRIAKFDTTQSFWVTKVPTLDFSSLEVYTNQNRFKINKNLLNDNGWALNNEEKTNLMIKLQKTGIQLMKLIDGKMFYGLKTGLNKAFLIDENTKIDIIKENPTSEQIIKPYLLGKEIVRYKKPKNEYFLICMPNGWTTRISQKSKNPRKWLQDTYPSIVNHLIQFEIDANNRSDMGEFWWELRSCDYYEEFSKAKICWGNLSNEPPFTIDYEGNFINAPACFMITDDCEYFLGCLNSNVLWWYLREIAAERAGGFVEAKPMYISQLPIRLLNRHNKTENVQFEKMVDLVKKMLEFQERYSETTLDGQREIIQSKISIIDSQINLLVYEIYNLTNQEIEIIESSLNLKQAST
jgi:hypothetical protein